MATTLKQFYYSFSEFSQDTLSTSYVFNSLIYQVPSGKIAKINVRQLRFVGRAFDSRSGFAGRSLSNGIEVKYIVNMTSFLQKSISFSSQIFAGAPSFGWGQTGIDDLYATAGNALFGSQNSASILFNNIGSDNAYNSTLYNNIALLFKNRTTSNSATELIERGISGSNNKFLEFGRFTHPQQEYFAFPGDVISINAEVSFQDFNFTTRFQEYDIVVIEEDLET